MKFFKFNPTGEETVLERGEIINNIEKAMWVERFSTPGEFSFEAKLSSGIGAFLPVGTLISHLNTLEVMIVENQQIKETVDSDPDIVVTGRDFSSYLENRIVGVNLARASSTIATYDLTADKIWNQVVKIINDHIKDATNTNDRLDDVVAVTSLGTAAGESVARTINRGTVLEEVTKLLAMEDLGLKTVRKHTFGGSPATTTYEVYRGVDKSDTVMFSWRAGHLESIEYLFSQKSLKTSALVIGQYVYIMVDTAFNKYDRRMMIVDAKDIDGHLDTIPTGGTLTSILAAMTIRGQQALAAHNDVVIGQADIAKLTKYQYRRDFSLGDLVGIDGNFSAHSVMRVTEYAEIEDENGESGHPTLTHVNE